LIDLLLCNQDGPIENASIHVTNLFVNKLPHLHINYDFEKTKQSSMTVSA